MLLKLEDYNAARGLELARSKFIDFVRRLWGEGFIEGRHHRAMSKIMDGIVRRELKRVCINLGPRHSKSKFGSIYLPANYFGHHPTHQIMQLGNTQELVSGFGREVRNIVGSAEYQEIFPGVGVSEDSRAADRWNTNHGGSYLARGIGGTVTGRGADLQTIDDPHSEQEAALAAFNPKVFDSAYEWYLAGPRQRLQPGAAILLTMCVAEGQRVLMGDGTWRQIETIAKGDVVIGYENGWPVQKKVLAAKCSGEDDVVKITTRSTALRVNRRHPILVVRGGLTKSPKNQADVIASRNWRLEWIPAGEIKAKDVVVTIKSMRNSVGYRPMAFGGKRQMNQMDYWLLGFMFGDGWMISCKGRGDVGYCIAKSKYDDLNEKVLAACERCFGDRPVETKHGYWRADRAHVAHWLRDIGFSSGAKTKRLPEWTFKLRPCDKRAFLKGFCEADGWLRPCERVQNYTVGIANYALLDDLRLLARTCGVKTTKIRTSIRISQAPSSPEPILAEQHFANFADKHDKIEMRHRYRQQGDAGRFYRLERVDSVESDGRSNVYDLTVDGAESFVAEGVVVHNTRWGKRDLQGRIIQDAINNGSIGEWKIFEFPAVMPAKEGFPDGVPLWPEFWSLEELLAVKRDLPIGRWLAQYQQTPTTDEGAVVKREWWREWEGKLPEFVYKVQSWDTAFTAKTHSDYSACTTWGVFYHDDAKGRRVAQVMLIDSWRDRVEFPDLKAKAKQLNIELRPDTIIIESRSSGPSLIQELRSMGIMVEDNTPARGAKGERNDKLARLNAVSDLFKSGFVWYNPTRVNKEVIEEFAEFPAGEHDDFVDSGTQALQRLRNSMFIGTSSDEHQLYEDEDKQRRERRPSRRLY